MNRNIFNFTVILFSLIFIIFLITQNNLVLESVSFSISIWKDSLFPTLFPFFVVSNILIQYGFIEIISIFFSKPMEKLFKLPGSCSFVFIISLFSGFPSGAKYTKELYIDHKINLDEANRLLVFTHYSNPLFIMGFIGNIILNNTKLSLIILLSHIIGGILTGIVFNINKDIKTTINYKNKDILYEPFGIILSNSIFNGLNTMFLLLGIVSIFSIISSLIGTIGNLSIFNKSIISGILEMTQGIKNISNLNISLYLKTILITFFISFGGLSVHMQVLSIISECKIKYKLFFIARIIHSIISIFILSILYRLIN